MECHCHQRGRGLVRRRSQAADQWNIIKYGNGPLDATLMENGLIDEFHLLLTPVAIGRGQHMFEAIDAAPALKLVDVIRFRNGVLAPSFR